MNDETKQYPNPIAERESKPAPAEAPDFLKGDDWYGVDIHEDFLDFTERYQAPRYTLMRNGVKFANVGDLHIISGKPGNGKTGLMTMFMAALLCGKNGKTEYALPDRKPKVLYVDTEQSKDDSIALKNRVCVMANRDYAVAYDDFFVLRLRDTELESDRWRKVLKAIYELRPTDIFLDGMLDIVEDYNDQKECQPIIRKCMMLATYYDTSLWAVLHENPMVDKLVGTLGSITQRKVSEIFTVIKVKQADLKPNEKRDDLPDIYFKVKQNKARGRDVADWLFQYVTNQGGWGEPKEIDAETGAAVVNTSDMKAQQFIKEADERFSKLNWTSGGLSRTDVDNALYSQGVTSNRRRGALIDTGIEHGIIYKTGEKQRPKYHYNGLNKEQPNDQAEEIDFTPLDGPVPY